MPGNNNRVLRLALVQTTSSNQRDPNLATLKTYINDAAQANCDMVAFPEIAGLTDQDVTVDSPKITLAEQDPFIRAAQKYACECRLWVHTGSTPVRSADGNRLLNRSNLVDDVGRLVASYDKIHLCDITPKGAEPILESRTYSPGEKSVLAETPWGKMGMSICYDLRFPKLYRQYAQSGAVVLFVPAAFSVPTGRDHWETLLRARAIENGAFVVAAAQTGRHPDGRETWGQSMVVSPNGQILIDLKREPGMAVVEIEIDQVAAARQRVPSLTHDRDFC